MRYMQIVGEVYFTGDGKAHYSGLKDSVGSTDAEFVVAFCTEVVAEIEARVGDIEHPFGRDKWRW
jgi:hypothetical protein